MTAPVVLRNYGKLRGSRVGIMLHYDASASDKGAVAWLTKDPRCTVSYTKLVLDDGLVVDIAPDDARAWHAGDCRPSRDELRYRDANSAFYGIALAARHGDRCTPEAFDAVAQLCTGYMRAHGWTEDWRITTHKAEAWPRGRKVDPDGVLDVAEVRAAVLARLAG
jgi:N-acetyl-anhydromuramyl-L-alanine amidase AmpD